MKYFSAVGVKKSKANFMLKTLEKEQMEEIRRQMSGTNNDMLFIKKELGAARQ